MLKLVSVLMLFTVVGCIVYDDGPYYSRYGDSEVIVEATHVHSSSCGHFYHRGHWYYRSGHVHGPACGHTFSGGIWIGVR